MVRATEQCCGISNRIQASFISTEDNIFSCIFSRTDTVGLTATGEIS